MRRDLVVAALAVLALLAVSFFGGHETSPSAATRASGDFSFGGYRAWYELLGREGLAVERFRRHHDALRTSGVATLIVAFPAAPASLVGGGTAGVAWSAAERDALRRWVREGGRMVDVGLTPPVDKDDAKGERVFLQPARGRRGRLRGPWASLVGSLAVRGDVRLAPLRRARVQTLLADDAGALVVRYASGRGEVIGVADGTAFENRFIGRGDDARLAYLVASTLRGPVAFDEAIRGDVVEKPWYRALTAPELTALALAALAGVLWLAYGIVPLGPPVRLRTAREPTSEEFLDAVAALYGRARARDHAGDALVRAGRRALERAPATEQNRALAVRIAAAAREPLRDEGALVAFAQVVRAARENEVAMMVDGARRTRRTRGTVRRQPTGPA